MNENYNDEYIDDECECDREPLFEERHQLKHLFGRVYFMKPCFVCFKIYNRKLVVVLNVLLTIVTIGLVALVVSKVI